VLALVVRAHLTAKGDHGIKGSEARQRFATMKSDNMEIVSGSRCFFGKPTGWTVGIVLKYQNSHWR